MLFDENNDEWDQEVHFQSTLSQELLKPEEKHKENEW